MPEYSQSRLTSIKRVIDVAAILKQNPHQYLQAITRLYCDTVSDCHPRSIWRCLKMLEELGYLECYTCRSKGVRVQRFYIWVDNPCSPWPFSNDQNAAIDYDAIRRRAAEYRDQNCEVSHV